MEERVRVRAVGRPSSHQNPESWWGHNRTKDQLTSVFVPALILAMQGWTNQFPSFCPLIYKMYEYPPFTHLFEYLPGCSDGKESVYNAGDLGSIPGLGRSPGEGNGNPLQYYCLENPIDRGARKATVHKVAKTRTQLSNFTFTFTFI